MGQFSWLDCQDNKTPILDDVREDCFVLIPKEFGGGHIVEHCYDGYGTFGGHDIYDLVAIWNREYIASSGKFKLCSWQPYFSDLTLSVEEVLEAWNENYKEKWGYGGNELRNIGIDIACYDEQNAALKFPIKITHDCNAVYENEGPSNSDPYQGWDVPRNTEEDYWEDEDEYFEEDEL